jgi:predicted transcriptional regulator
LKYRSSLLVYMEVLKVLIDGPLTATRLSQVVNIHYDKTKEILADLKNGNLIASTTQENNEVYVITQEGLILRRDFEKIWARLRPPWSEGSHSAGPS